MIDREGSEMQMVCDATGTRHPKTYDREDFDIMIADAREDGWPIKIEKGEWRHYCPASRSAAAEFEELLDID